MNKRILLVEHHEYLRKLLGGFFAPHFEVIGAKDALEALAWLNTGWQPDVIVVGAQLPKISTVQFLSTIKHSGLHAGIPVAVLGEKPEDEHPFLAMGAQVYLSKPFDPLVLNEQINRMIQPVFSPET
ncbi:MAG: response regulator transcription factor [Saprospiraceae bacterium]|nr:response regulator transcription factor [Saprospiraceae bacterium]